MSFAIRAEGLAKCYQLGQRREYAGLREAITASVRAPWRWLRGQGRTAPSTLESIWALRDASFEIGEGEIIGLIGRNGSGKSTLLKILSRITEPTAGRAMVRGRVGSLLEVGTGFHHELTGRENVFVNGAILGMRRAEIARKFDEIVAFADIDAFIDTPVKYYSSGMQMRLAFSVAAHLEPEILLVDEVLAVGDLAFQRKCLGKMDEVSRAGRTVVFVSHQLNQIRRLCSRAIWLEQGVIRHAGNVGDALHQYELAAAQGGVTAPGQVFERWALRDGGHTVRNGDRPVTVRVTLALGEDIAQGHLGLSLTNEQDTLVGGWAFEPLALRAGRRTLEIEILSLPLQPGLYRLAMALFNNGNNLTGGRLLERWVASPYLTLDVAPLSHPQDQYAGMLNVPARMVEDRHLVAVGQHAEMVYD